MKKKIIWIVAVVFGIVAVLYISLWSFALVTQPDLWPAIRATVTTGPDYNPSTFELIECIGRDGGEWSYPANGCVDACPTPPKCSGHINIGYDLCAQALIAGCGCAEGQCMDSATGGCIPTPEYASCGE